MGCFDEKSKRRNRFRKYDFQKTAIIKRKIFHKDKVIVNAKSKKEFIEAIEYSEATIDLEKFIVSTSYKLYNKKQSKYVLDNSSQVQCSLKK